jgi:hypothetical protein
MFFRMTPRSVATLAEDHKTVLLSILATLLAALIMFVATIVISGGIAIDLVRGYVMPLIISAFTLAVFWSVLFAHHKGKIPWLDSAEPKKDENAPTVQKPSA